MNKELYLVYVGERLDRRTVGIADSLDDVRRLVSEALLSEEHGQLARECFGYEGPFQLNQLDT